MRDDELADWITRLSLLHFKKPFLHTARFNPRLRTTGGRYLLKCHSIEMNPHHLLIHGEEAFEKTIKHELCHYHLHLMKKGYRHSDSDFKNLLQEVGGSRYCPDTGLRRPLTTSYQYKCTGCAHIYRRKKKMRVDLYRCGLCRGRLAPNSEGITG